MEKHSRVYAKIDLDAIAFNLDSMKKNIKPDTKMICVVKTDGYGHGAYPIAAATESREDVWGFAVATVEEAEELAERGIRKPILILGYTFPEHYERIVAHNLRPTVFKYEMAAQISQEAVRQGKTLNIHIAVDTGMSRIGYQVTEEAADEVKRIGELPGISIEGVFTHFSKADETDHTFTYGQIEKYDRFIQYLRDRGVQVPICHSANSAGIIEYPESNMDVVRAGISIYGLYPSEEVDKNKVELKPALELKTHIVYIKTLEADRYVSYGGTFKTTKECRVATIPVGYGDGYPRGLSGKGHVLIHGKKAPILGRVCMDQFMVDVTDIPEAKEQDEVTLVGMDNEAFLSVEELGDISDRFNYEFVCCIGKRVPRVYYKEGKLLEEF